MKKLSMTRLAELVSGKRKEKSMTQQELADATGINRSLLSRLEKKDFILRFRTNISKNILQKKSLT